jgi:hypothetical protein
MKKTLTLILAILLAAFALSACASEEIEVPDGLQIVKISSADGYRFFGPEGWIVANDGRICASYVSTINNTSISLAKIKTPDVSVQEYFNSEKSRFAYEITVIEEGETTFGNAESAYYFVYTFKYEERDFATMQIFVKNADDFYIFTYNSYGDPNAEDSEYQNYLKQVRPAIDAFKFVEKSVETKEEASATVDSDGYILSSDKALCGFDLYLPPECEIIQSSTQVSAKLSDKANVNITKASRTGVSILDYLKSRKSQLEALFGEVTDISIQLSAIPDLSGDKADLFADFDVAPTEKTDIKFGTLNKSQTIVYEYSYAHLGVTYRVYQILGVDSYNGYVLTYTATADEYESHLDTLKTILDKVNFE